MLSEALYQITQYIKQASKLMLANSQNASDFLDLASLAAKKISH